jgi:hypothetical protein
LVRGGLFLEKSGERSAYDRQAGGAIKSSILSGLRADYGCLMASLSQSGGQAVGGGTEVIARKSGKIQGGDKYAQSRFLRDLSPRAIAIKHQCLLTCNQICDAIKEAFFALKLATKRDCD